MRKLDAFLKSVVQSEYGMSIRDVMVTDYQQLMAVLQATDEIDARTDEVMNLGDFINSL